MHHVHKGGCTLYCSLIYACAHFLKGGLCHGNLGVQRPTCPTTLLGPWSMFSLPFEGAWFKEGSAWEGTHQNFNKDLAGVGA